MRKQFVSIVFIVLAVAGISACSSSDEVTTASSSATAPGTSSTSSSPGSTTAGSTGSTPDGPKGEFISEADAICVETAKQTSALAIDLNGTNPDIAAQADAIDQSIALGEAALTQLRALTPPPGDEATVTAFWDGLAAQLEQQKQVSALVRANDLQGAQAAVQQGQTTGKQLTADLEAYGFVGCAN